jgi:hypothetical protein
MWATFDLVDAEHQLKHAISNRLYQHPVADTVDTLRFPVAFFFVRGDRGGEGAKLAEQVVKSYGYWNDDAGKYLDVVFPGWGKDGETIVFDRTAFLHCREQLERNCKWRYSGQSDVLLLNYESKRGGGATFAPPRPSFESCIWLPVEDMIKKGRIANLDQLMHDLIVQARACWDDPAQGGVWQISDRIGFYRGLNNLWEKLKNWLDVSGLYDELRPFAVCDLRQK